MKPDSKQVPQLVVLGILVLVCVGYVSFQVMCPGTKKHVPADQKASQTNRSSASQASAFVSPELGAHSIFPNLGAFPERRDPFTPQRLPGTITSESTSTSVSKPQSAPSTSIAPLGRLPKIDVRPFNPFSQAPETNPTARQSVGAEQETKFILTGVVRGAQNVAILRTGEGGRYVVKQGQLINGRYRVILVTDSAVLLGDGNRRIYVKLGGV